MKPFKWDFEKETVLVKFRNVSFERVVDQIAAGDFRVIKDNSSVHPNQQA